MISVSGGRGRGAVAGAALFLGFVRTSVFGSSGRAGLADRFCLAVLFSVVHGGYFGFFQNIFLCFMTHLGPDFLYSKAHLQLILVRELFLECE